MATAREARKNRVRVVEWTKRFGALQVWRHIVGRGSLKWSLTACGLEIPHPSSCTSYEEREIAKTRGQILEDHRTCGKCKAAIRKELRRSTQ